ncbi:MAG: phosphoribosylanthranilate isomerase [Armatimonadetes bacterium]|nr:phosphoribosylanthranilate isomerase [Armatimonadota bacterium]
MALDRVELKVCGLARVADMRGAEAAGVDYCGFIVEIERSPRSIPRETAALLARGCRARPVLVVEDMALDDLMRLAEQVRPAAVQLHGGDAAGISRLVGALAGRASVWRPVGLPPECGDRAAAVSEALAEIAEAADAGASAVVLDTRTASGTGGSGVTCDWEAAAAIVTDSPLPVILAGGLSPENLREAVERVAPAGVDLSSSLESAPGVKDAGRLKELGRVWKEMRG